MTGPKVHGGMFAEMVKRRFGLLAKFVSLHALVQVVAIVTGLLVVRNMDKLHYAWYTIVFGLQGGISALSQFAISGGILAMGGERIHDRLGFGQVMAAARAQRWRLIAIGLPLLVPIYAFLLLKAEASPAITVALIVVVILNLSLLMEEQICAVPFALAKRYSVSQWYELGTFALRLVFVAGLLVAGYFHPVLVITASVAALAIGVLGFLQPASRTYVDPGARADPLLRHRFFKYSLNGIPTMLNTVVQSQLGLILIAWFGHMESAADLGAISKMILLFGIPTAVVDRIFIARMATETDRRRLQRVWLQGVAFALACGGLIVWLVSMFSPQVIWVLGDQYASLADDLLLYCGFLAFGLVSSAAFGVLQAKGWLKHSWLVPLTILGAEALACPWVDLGSVQGVILVKFAGDLAGAIHAAVLLARGFAGRGRI